MRANLFKENQIRLILAIMKFRSFLFWLGTLILATAAGLSDTENQNYLEYHQQIMEAETRISEENFEAALAKYEVVFTSYEFVFLREGFGS